MILYPDQSDSDATGFGAPDLWLRIGAQNRNPRPCAPDKGAPDIPVRYTIFDRHALILVRYTETVTSDEIIDALAAYQKGAQYNPAHNYLIDMSKAGTMDVDFPRMLTVASRISPMQIFRKSDTRTAFYAPHDIAFGLARMYQSIAAGRVNFEIGVFRQLAEAFDFIAVPFDTLDPTERAAFEQAS